MTIRAAFIAFALVLSATATAQDSKLATATFAGGCFWCMEEAFEKVPGVASAVSGYIGGSKKSPSYEEVSTGRTGHTEAVQVKYDPAKVTYEQLLRHFWINHDPTTIDAQFCDHGSQYKPAIFWHDEQQKRLAEASKAQWEKDKPFKAAIVTPILKATEFWLAEDYHQDYYKKNSVRYQFYVSGCGRYSRLDQLWGKLRAK
jgi:peptide-methionine (S)-S-oxide reductase